MTGKRLLIWGIPTIAVLIGFVASLTLQPDPAYGFVSELNISWGAPTQAERDGSKLFFVTDPATSSSTMDILVYVDGLESGKTYEIEVEVKEKGGPEDIKAELEVEDLIGEEVPTLPPVDPPN